MAAVAVGVDEALGAWFASSPAQGSTLRAKRAAVRDWAVWLGELGVDWAAADAADLVDSWVDDHEGQMSSTWLTRRRNYIAAFCEFVQESGFGDGAVTGVGGFGLDAAADDGAAVGSPDVAGPELLEAPAEPVVPGPAAGEDAGPVPGRALEALEELAALGRSAVGG